MATATAIKTSPETETRKEQRINYHPLTDAERAAAELLQFYVKKTIPSKASDHPLDNKKYWGTIPYNLVDFCFFLKQAYFFKPPSEETYKIFLDIGCGLGHTLALATRLFHYTSQGIENNLSLKDETDFRIWFGDAFDYPAYSKADVLYQYRPIRDNKLQAKLEEFVEDSAKVGAIIFKVDYRSNRIFTDPRFSRLYHSEIKNSCHFYLPLFLKIKA